MFFFFSGQDNDFQKGVNLKRNHFDFLFTSGFCDGLVEKKERIILIEVVEPIQTFETWLPNDS